MADFEQLVVEFLNGAELLRAAVAGMSQDDLHKKPIEGKWSTHEVVCHLVDFEIINTDRIKRILSEDNPTLFDADPDPLLEKTAYGSRDFKNELNLIAALRTHVGTILRSISPEQWERKGVHTAAGPISLEQLVKRTTKHIVHHLPFIEEKRKAMGI